MRIAFVALGRLLKQGPIRVVSARLESYFHEKHSNMRRSTNCMQKVGFNEAAYGSATLIGTNLDNEAGVILIPL
jgi:hypothetical protein